jgi:hypothetical protein
MLGAISDGQGSVFMDTKTFDRFVSQQQESSASVNWSQVRNEWLGDLDQLYSKIESFLAKYLHAGQIRLEYRIISLNERDIGAYNARQMVLRIGRQQVDLVPVGTLLMGSKGQVDVVGPAGKAEIMLVDGKLDARRPRVLVTVGVGGRLASSEQVREPHWEWRIVSPPPERRYIEITQESLFQLIMEVANV